MLIIIDKLKDNLKDKEVEVFKIIKEILIIKMELDEEDILLESRLRDDLCLDSLDTIELTMEIEMHYKISIPDLEVEKLGTLKELVTLVEEMITP